MRAAISTRPNLAYIGRMAVAFDTLKLARRLEAAGFSTQQAQDTAEALGEVLTTGLATQADLQALGSEIDALRVATQADIQGLRGEIREAELRLRGEINARRAELIKWTVGVGIAAVLAIGGMVLSATMAVLRALPHS